MVIMCAYGAFLFPLADFFAKHITKECNFNVEMFYKHLNEDRDYNFSL